MLKVLVAYDGSETAQRALHWVRDLSDPVVTVVNVIPTLSGSPRIADATDPTRDTSDHQERLEEALALLGEDGIEAATVDAAGNEAEEILRVCEEGGYDLVVVGYKGQSAAQRFLIGSVSDRVVRHAPCTVVVVR